MADQDFSSGHRRTFAQVVRLTPPPTYRQFATERVRAHIKERKAGKKLREALGRRGEADEQGRGRVNPVEVARVWNLISLRDLRADLPPSEQEKLRALLVTVLSGETELAVWHKTLNALGALRRASEPAVGAPRRWRLTWPAEQEW
jgi:hypothetical protein